MDEQSQKWRDQRRAVALCVLGAMPTLLAFFLTESSPAQRPFSGRSERANLAFAQYAVDLGPVKPAGTIPAHFDFWNDGDSSIEILELDPSCGCLAPKMHGDKMSYAPGEQGRFYVSVKTANETPGPKDYKIRVKYRDDRIRERIVTFRLDIPEMKVSVTPSELYFYQLNGSADSREVVVEDHRGQDLNVLDVTSSTDFATPVLGEKVLVEGISKTPIRVDIPENVPSGRRTALLTIKTDDPEYGTIRVPILIWGKESKIQPVNLERLEAKDGNKPH